MTIFLLLLGGLAVWAVVASIVVVARDGYRRQPVRPQPETWRSAAARLGDADRSDAGPADRSSAQWLRTPASVGPAASRPQHTAGVMVMRTW